jgi:hypothetical protein
MRSCFNTCLQTQEEWVKLLQSNEKTVEARKYALPQELIGVCTLKSTHMYTGTHTHTHTRTHIYAYTHTCTQVHTHT